MLSHARLFATPWTYSPQNSPGQNTGVGSFSLLQGKKEDPSQPRDWTQVSHISGDSLPTELSGKPGEMINADDFSPYLDLVTLLAVTEQVTDREGT